MHMEFSTVSEPFVALLEECLPLTVTLRANSNSPAAWGVFSSVGEDMRVSIARHLNNFDEIQVRVHTVGKDTYVWCIGVTGEERKVLLEPNEILEDEDLEYIRKLADTKLIPWWQSAEGVWVWLLVPLCIIGAVAIPVHFNWDHRLSAGWQLIAAAFSVALLANAALLILSTHRDWVRKATTIRSALAALVKKPAQ